MTFLLQGTRETGSRAAVLLATVTVAAGLALGATGAQASPNDPAPDFLMKVGASSASFEPLAGSPGEYRLVLRDASSKARVTELTRAETSASVPMNAFLAYWTTYGDETGQFKANPPRAVLQSADGRKEVVVRLRDASQEGETVRFDAQVITSPAVWDQLENKVDKVDDDQQPDEHRHILKPKVLTDVEMFVDMPKRITQPDAPEPTLDQGALASRSRTPRTSFNTPARKPDNLTCAGVRSSRLRMCWNEMESITNSPDLDEEEKSNRLPWRRWQAYDNGSDGIAGFAFLNVGWVDLYPHYWRTGLSPYFNTRGQIGKRERWYPFGCDWVGYVSGYTCVPPQTTTVAVEDLWYGVHRDGRTFYLTSRCTWFMAAWSPRGRCR